MQCNNHSVVGKIVRAAFVIGTAAILVSLWPDFKRYIKIERM